MSLFLEQLNHPESKVGKKHIPWKKWTVSRNSSNTHSSEPSVLGRGGELTNELGFGSVPGSQVLSTMANPTGLSFGKKKVSVSWLVVVSLPPFLFNFLSPLKISWVPVMCWGQCSVLGRGWCVHECSFCLRRVWSPEVESRGTLYYNREKCCRGAEQGSLDLEGAGKTFSTFEIEIWTVKRSQPGKVRFGDEGDEWEGKILCGE